ncbi:gluconokinase [Demequina muriae]|uniref:Gluconokinase n=1 Tax=Demequina muriae TaxID=3051664 RepID=A0ABT8GJ47_9MICO|nr:gluconokinase, GntK/IdnK-type [Demequina sp. EGI L300058]MDN4480976.1 gluconokinase, GntK/IdnK-type [Demequina sp. EGI L300058]
MRVVVMGVTGCGKSTVGMRLAHELKAQFCDGDDLHSATAIAKMAAGIALTDEDRWPWLDAVATWLEGQDRGIVACSALKRVYRDCIRDVAGDSVVFVHLAAPQSVLEPRVRRRAEHDGHFAPAGLLDSQYAVLEPLEADELGGKVPVHRHSPEGATLVARAIVESARR